MKSKQPGSSPEKIEDLGLSQEVHEILAQKDMTKTYSEGQFTHSS